MLIKCSLNCRAEDLPLDEIDNVYLVDFVGPPGFIQQLSPKVERQIHCSVFFFFFLRIIVCGSRLLLCPKMIA